jgi:hypothetical protein
MANVRAVEEYARALAISNNVAPKMVMRDIADHMEIMARYGRENVKNLIDATVQAHKLGTSIDHIDSLMDNLLDFEGSLDAEMQASAMLGRTLDLSAARQAALHNDQQGVMTALREQLGGIEFGELNRLQQNALRDALGGFPIDEIVKIGEFERQGDVGLRDADMKNAQATFVEKLGTYTPWWDPNNTGTRTKEKRKHKGNDRWAEGIYHRP